MLLHEPSQKGQSTLLRPGTRGLVVQMLPSKADLLQLQLGIRQRLVHDTGVKPRGKEAGIQHEDRHIGRDTQLTRLEHGVTGPEVAVQAQLRLIHGETLHLSLFVLDPIEVIESPEGRIEPPAQALCKLLIRCSHGGPYHLRYLERGR